MPDNDKLVAVGVELVKFGHTAQVLDVAGVVGLNVFGDDRRFPIATVWPPHPPRSVTWDWGHSFEHSASDQLTAAELAASIAETLKEKD